MKPVHSRHTPGLSLLAVILLLGVGCGGGGGGGGPTTPLATTVTEVEFESFQLANAARRESGVRPLLERDERAAQVARAHSEAMRDQGFFSHQGPDGDLAVRLRGAGIAFSSAGENLAKLSSVPNPAAEAHAQFLQSADHRDVMLDAGFELAGVGVARSGDTYWLTQIYLRP